MKVKLYLTTENRKTGNIPVSISDSSTCPGSCPLNGNGCYAQVGFLNFHWRKINQGIGFNLVWKHFLNQVKNLPAGQLWRHNVAGDLPGKNERINFNLLKQLVKANKGKRGFTYTHKKPTGNNKKHIKYANNNGFVVNLSANNIAEADDLMKQDIGPVVTVLRSEQRESFITPGRNKVIICPYYTHNVTCKQCKLCQWKDRPFIIGFPAHGIMRERVNRLI